MSTNTGIEWTDATWNPVVGCERVSPGCAHCYAKALHDQRHASYLAGKLQMIPQYAHPFETVQLKPERLSDPLRWRAPRRVFVNSVSDLFHADVPDAFLDDAFVTMAMASQHTFQILTKRPARMREYVLSRYGRRQYLPNVWLGVSVENQRFADERIPLLLDTPAAVRFLSCEPLLGPVSFRWAAWVPFAVPGGWTNHLDGLRGIDWIIAGGESGPKARPCELDWLRAIRDQCREAGVAFFLKQLGGERDKRGGDAAVLDGERWTEMPRTVAA